MLIRSENCRFLHGKIVFPRLICLNNLHSKNKEASSVGPVLFKCVKNYFCVIC